MNVANPSLTCKTHFNSPAGDISTGLQKACSPAGDISTGLQKACSPAGDISFALQRLILLSPGCIFVSDHQAFQDTR